MPYAQSAGAKLYYEETGSGYPIIFAHEFGGDVHAWDAQVRWFSRDYRCVTFNARGYRPSDVPEDPKVYEHPQPADDIAAVLKHLGISKAHVVGLSMGAYATLHFGLRHPGLASALVVAGCGSGAPRAERETFRIESEARADRFLKEGSPAVAREMGLGRTRIQLKDKDPQGWEAHVRHLGEHDATGSAMTMRNYQARRPSLWDSEAELAKMKLPVLLVVGDEDDPCVEANIFLKKTIPGAGLWMFPRTGHLVNLEDPATFNRVVQDFFGTVERGRWRPQRVEHK
jgi:pimeloyl-ACP methyl ester carboxylesterase